MMWLTVLVIAIAAAMMMAVQEVPVMTSSEIISTDNNIIELAGGSPNVRYTNCNTNRASPLYCALYVE